jgi:hypothetical protein
VHEFNPIDIGMVTFVGFSSIEVSIKVKEQASENEPWVLVALARFTMGNI